MDSDDDYHSLIMDVDDLDQDVSESSENQDGDEVGNESEHYDDRKRKRIHLQLEERQGEEAQSGDNGNDHEEFDAADDEEYIENDIVVLEERIGGKNVFEIIPDGWIEIKHNSGMPIYLHRESRVCSVSKPYMLGPGSARMHSIPIDSIPCLAYARAKEIEKKSNEQENGSTSLDKNRGSGEDQDQPGNQMKESSKHDLGLISDMPSVQIESAKENKSTFYLDPIQFREYCQKVFEFKTVTRKRFKTWSAKRRHIKDLKKQSRRPEFSDSAQLITYPVKCPNGKGYKDYSINLTGKTPIAILHEFIQHSLRKQPLYEFKETDNSATPFSAIVFIDNMEYGTGYGTSKKQAKLECAKIAIQILIPDLKGYFDDQKKEQVQDGPSIASIFDHIKMDDPRIESLCLKAGEPNPYNLLLNCLQRNFGKLDNRIRDPIFELISTDYHKNNRFKMSAAGFQVEVQALNKKEGKQLAAQGLLAKIHPDINNISSFLRLYGNSSAKIPEKKQEREITSVQSRASTNSSNYSLLDKLKEEMLKLPI